MKEKHLVHVLHKCLPSENGKTLGALAVGKTFVFPNSKDRYTVQESGAVVNADPKPWRSKAERKALKRARRQQEV